uniref:Calponin-homology (CH) domain-containing protein n=1 Tax=Meloidogyne javanica TaxID=6303 RepID=A0A915MDZ1_MELJA
MSRSTISPYSSSSHSQQPKPTNNLLNQNIIMEEDLLQDETLYFERNRIKQLKDERRDIQKKTFTKWCNTYLSRLENIGAEDIADGNEHLILGLIWTIILRFTIENIEIEAKESGERKHAKEALLLWCQRKTAGYPNVRIDNFSSSWRSGLAFCALIHSHHPELINFDGLNTQDPLCRELTNLNMAFDVAERKLDIARLLDAEDVNVSCPDEKSIITYVSLFYHCFAKEKSELTGARRVAKVVGELVQLDSLQEDYEQLAADLLCWIHQKINELADRHFPNLLISLRELLATFSCFRKEEKPPKYKEKGELEALFFAIQTKRNAGRRKSYIPPEGLGLHDLESAWTELEKAEHARQGALINELQRQERLELRAQLFHKKADVRDAWLREMQSVLNQFECQFECQQNSQTVDAGLRLLRNISAEYLPKTSRFALLSELSIELQRENFHDFENIRTRERDIFSRWNKFLAILEQKEQELGRLGELSNLLGELEELKEELTQMGKELGRQRTQENCKHLAAVDELLRRLELTENNIRAKKEWLIQLNKKAKQYVKTISSNIGGNEQLFECLNEREQQLNYLQSELKQHRAALQRAREFFQFIAHWEEQISWLTDRLSLCQSLSTTRDLSNISQSQRAHKSLEAEMAGQWERTKLLIGDGERLNQPEEVHGRLEILQKKWEELRIANIALLSWIREADRLQQYFQDANETESWIRERMPLAQSEDFGRDIALYAYNGNNKNKNGGNIFVSRGEELALLDNSNKDWWRKIRDEITNQGQTQFSQLTEMSEQLITQCNNINSYSHSRVGEDLRPLADRMNTLWTQANQISEEQPERAEEVQAKVQSLEVMHAELLAQARAWIEQAERSQGQQMFEQAASELLDWTQKCSEQINLPCDLFPSSSSSLPSASEEAAEEALRRNSELREQIDGKQFEFGYVEELGQRLIEKGYPKEQVKQKLEELEHAKNELEFQWQKREDDCRRLLELQAFTREADRINSLNRGQLAFLDLSSSQADSVEKVQNLLKGQAEFEAKLSAQEERVLLFVASADRLIRTGHSQSGQIENQKREVVYGHQGVIERTQMRRAQLERGLALEGLRRDASELGLWINEKRHQMEQQNEVGGVGGLNWAQTRHQAFMLELPANRAELSRLAK